MERRLAAIFAADVAGYSRLVGADEEGTLARLSSHRRELFEPKIAEHQGRLVKIMGDGVLAEVASPAKAVRCALDVQHGLAARHALTGLSDSAGAPSARLRAGRARGRRVCGPMSSPA